MRTLPTPLKTSLAGAFTAPGYLAELTFSDGSIARCSSRGPMNWGGHLWAEFLAVSGVDQQSGGVMSASLSVDRNAFIDAVSAQGAKPLGVKIWQGDGGEMLLMFQGKTQKIKIEADGIEMACTNWTHRRPITLSPPLLEYITPAGTIIDWGGKRLITESSR